MDIVIAHNFYQQAGGEDQCVEAEIAMLRSNGHRVTQYCISNDLIETMGRVDLASRTIWSQPAYRELRELFRTNRPQIAHFHNTFPLMSPAAYYAARAENVGVVQTLHNFRLCCPNALFFRDGKSCEDCLGKAFPWPSIVHKCYRNSRVASAAVATMSTVHRALGTWSTAVDMYIALSEFSRSKLIAGGLPADRIAIKPNFAYPDPGVGEGKGGYAVYVGRLSEEKGVETILGAWRQLGGKLPLKVVGDGPLSAVVQADAAKDGAIQWLGSVPLETVYALIGGASVLVLPSRCYENFPRVIVEAFAKGTPVIVPRQAAMAELVDDGCTGLHFRPGDAGDLAAKLLKCISAPLALAAMRPASRQAFESNFTAELNHRTLMSIYEKALDGCRSRAPAQDIKPVMTQ